MDYAYKVFHTFAFHFVAYAAGLAASVVLGRFLGVEGLGVFTLIIAFPPTIIGLVTFGLPSANCYFISKRPQERKYFIANTIYYVIGVGLLLALLWWLMIPLLKRVYFGERVLSSHLHFVILLLPLLLFISVTPSIFVGLYRILDSNIAEVLLPISRLTFYGVAVAGLGYGVAGALVGYVAAVLVVLVFIVIELHRLRVLSWRFGRTQFRETLSYGAKVFAGDLVAQVQQGLILILLGVFVTSLHLGLFVVGRTVSAFATWPTRAMMVPMLPRLARMEQPVAARMFCRILRVSLPISAAIALGLGVFASFVIPVLYGNEFRDSVLITAILLPGMVSIGISNSVMTYLMSIGLPNVRLWINVVRAVLILGGLTTGAALSGLNGAAIGFTAGGMTALFVALLPAIVNNPGVTLKDMLVFRREDAGYVWTAVSKVLRRPAQV